MRHGTTAESLRLIAEERQQGKRPLHGMDEGLANAQPDVILRMNGNDIGGTNRAFFVLGLHSPFDLNTTRILGGG